eukprot:3938597-Rhodomonas_salina.2
MVEGPGITVGVERVLLFLVRRTASGLPPVSAFARVCGAGPRMNYRSTWLGAGQKVRDATVG